MPYHYMDTEKALIYNIDGKRDINSIRLSYRIYKRLSEENKALYHKCFKEIPAEAPHPVSQDRLRPIRHWVAKFALWIYIKSNKKKPLDKCFKYAHKNLGKLLGMQTKAEQKLLEETCQWPQIEERHIARQFEFNGFIRLCDFKPIEESNDQACYITSSRTLEGHTYIFPHRLRMREEESGRQRSLWYNFESGLIIPGYTRVWYTMELKNLKRAQDDQSRNARGK